MRLPGHDPGAAHGHAAPDAPPRRRVCGGRGAQTSHRNRRYHLATDFCGNTTIDGHVGAAQGSVLREVQEAFEQAEYEADWAEARRLHGDRATAADLPRTAAQRAADAVVKIHLFAATAAAPTATPDAAAGPVRTPEPLVNIVVTDRVLVDEYNRQARAAGVGPEWLATADQPRLCQTLDGVPVPPSDALAMVFAGHLRRVLRNGRGVVVDLGRRRRFTGGARDALNLADTTCIWPGCRRAARRCQADHSDPVANGGPTDPHNGGPACGCHNRIKNNGFATYRRDDGTWQILRPDGTPIT